LLVGDDKNKPKEILPDSIAAFDYAPYGDLLPRAAAMVHQGGVGTTGQGLRAGIPMLVMPYSHDQPDNAARITRIGVGQTISRKAYKASHVAKELKEILENPAYAERAKEIGEKVRAEDGAKTAVDLMLKHCGNSKN
jgi:UDP:flavonoid glycosyltransferase YjiC (YdhE family)